MGINSAAVIVGAGVLLGLAIRRKKLPLQLGNVLALHSRANPPALIRG